MDRQQNIARLADSDPWDLVIIGGGATGLGAALDAASRGYRVALLEQSDFAKGTSSRSTKLIHGGVRYLQQRNVSLVKESLRERNLLCQNAPHLVHALEFIVPSYRWYDSIYYGSGLRVYDALAGKQGLGRSRHLSRAKTIQRLPTIRRTGLRGATLYVDAGFDDARLAMAIARSADKHAAAIVNYMRVIGFQKDQRGVIRGVVAEDVETGQQHEIGAGVVVNATGPFTDHILRLDDPGSAPMIAPSQGVHLVLDASFLPGNTALLIPRTSDGRLLFAIPWHGVTVVGTTDTAISEVSLEPQPRDDEIELLITTANEYLTKRITREDLRSVFVGIRPLVKVGTAARPSTLSRDHTIVVDQRSKLLTVTGGKWTTFRKMAEDTVDRAIEIGGLPRVECKTRALPLHGATAEADRFGALGVYGTDAREIQSLMKSDAALAQRVHPDVALPIAEVVWACRAEMARTVDDVLARRSRWLFLDARLAITAAEPVARIMQRELDRDDAWVERQVRDFEEIAEGYICTV